MLLHVSVYTLYIAKKKKGFKIHLNKITQNEYRKLFKNISIGLQIVTLNKVEKTNIVWQ